MKSVGKYFSIVIVVCALVSTGLIWVNFNNDNAVDVNNFKYEEIVNNENDNLEVGSPQLVLENVSEETKPDEVLQLMNNNTVNKDSLESLVNEETKEVESPVNEQSEPQTSEFKVVIVRVKKPYKTTYIVDSSLSEGEKVLKTKGVEGSEIITYEREYKENVLIGEKVISRTIGEETINEVIMIGSQKDDKPKELRSCATDSFNMQNDYRKSKGLSELEWDENLYQSVLIRANELTNSFSHLRPDGSSPFSVINISFNGAAENIAMKAKANDNIGYSFTEVWINSNVHHDNMVNSNYNRAAVAIVECNGIYFAVTMYLG